MESLYESCLAGYITAVSFTAMVSYIYTDIISVVGQPASGIGIDFSAIHIPGSPAGSSGGAGPSHGGGGAMGGGLPDDPATIREILLSSPHDLALLKERNPPLAEALLSGDLGESMQSVLILSQNKLFNPSTVC